MIKITSIEIDGFIIPSQSVKLDFVESNVVCIYGNNGSGKTSFLEILFAVFDRDEGILRKYNVQNIKIEYILDNIEIKKQIIKLKDDLKKLSDEDEIERVEEEIRELEQEINIIEKVNIYSDRDDKNQLIYYFDDEEDKTNIYNLNNSKLGNLSTLFLGIGRGIHKNELKIPKEMIWHFFRNNKKISEDKVLTGNEIDELSDKLIEYLIPKDDNNEIELYRARELDDKKNIYLPSIDINTIEAFLNNKYKEAVLDAKEKIEKILAQTSLNFLELKYKEADYKEPDLEPLRIKLLYNKTLLLEMFSNSENIGIESIIDKLEKNKNYLAEIGISQQIILSNMVEVLQSEVELFKEIELFVEEYNSFLNYDKELVFNSNGIFIAPKNHSIHKLSSGERHLLTFLATILLMGEEQDFILIDEPEISLNVDWQRKILSTIAKLAPHSQIIVATHSPLVARNYRKSVVGIEPKVKDEQ